MRLTKENYELLMFDLLEGNLPESDELKLMKQIEADDFFFKEWKAFKSTILPIEEHISFDKKELLYKEKEQRVIPMRIFYRASVAALLLLMLGIGIYQFRSEDQVVHITPPIEQIKINEGDPRTPVNEQKVLHKVQEEPLEPGLANNGEKNKVETVKPKHSPTPGQMVQKMDVRVLQDPIRNELPEPETINVEADPIIEKIVPEQIVNKDLQPAAIEDMQAPEAEKSKLLVTIGTVERIGLIMKNTIAQAAHPKLKFTPEWKNRSFTIALETDGYVAVASINPFNHKKQ